MAKGISIGNFADAVNDVLDAYGQIAEEGLQEAIDATAKEAVKDLKSSSPKGKTRKKGTYSKGWTSKVTANKKGAYGRTVHAGQGAPLTHLLEHGHALRRGGRTTGQASARPHIAAAEQRAINLFQKKLGEVLGR